MLKKIGVMTLLLVLFIPVLVHAELPSTVLTLFDATTKEPLDDIFINVEINGQMSQYYIEKDKDFVLSLDEGAYDVKILANKLSTEGYDYYGDFFLIVGSSPKVKIVYLHPVGSLYGTVKDQLDNVVAETDLHFECSKTILAEFPAKSDKFGSFSLDAVPLGICEVSAIHEGSIGTETIEIQGGSRANVEIQLDKSLITGDKNLFNGYLLAILIIAVVVILGFILYKFKPKIMPKQKEVKGGESKEKSKLGKRAQDVLKTLRENEKKIVSFVAEYGKPVHLSKIHHKTGLSKGTLSRNIDALEKKNILQTHKEGKVRKIKLSSWFLEE